MDKLTDRDEPPPEWAGRKSSTDIYYYRTEDTRERQLNPEMYLISYPWILRARDASGYLAYVPLWTLQPTCHCVPPPHQRPQ